MVPQHITHVHLHAGLELRTVRHRPGEQRRRGRVGNRRAACCCRRSPDTHSARCALPAAESCSTCSFWVWSSRWRPISSRSTIELRDFGLLDSRIGLILPLLAQSLPFGIFWMRAGFRAMPQSLVEAAWIDGASSFAVLRRILAPILRPAILTLLVLTFVFTWNDFLLSLVVITTQQHQTAPLALALFIGQRTTDVTGLAAGAVIISIPVIIVFVFFQRTLIRGILAGALKA